MKVIAKHNLNHNGVWHKGGEEFDTEDYAEIKAYVTPVQKNFVSEVFPPDEEVPKRRGRPKKTEE